MEISYLKKQYLFLIFFITSISCYKNNQRNMLGQNLLEDLKYKGDIYIKLANFWQKDPESLARRNAGRFHFGWNSGNCTIPKADRKVKAQLVLYKHDPAVHYFIGIWFSGKARMGNIQVKKYAKLAGNL